MVYMSPDDNASPQGNANENDPKDQLNAPQVNADTETPATQGGIFSTPDLTVDAQNIRLGQAALSENDKERVARAFGQTDATRRAIAEAEQVVNANATMPSTATGDIELGAKSKGKNRSKLPIIITAAVAVVAIVGTVVGVMLSSSKGGETAKNEVVAKFEEFRDFLMNGPVEDRTFSSDDSALLKSGGYPLLLFNGDSTYADGYGYFQQLHTLYDVFLDAANFAPDKNTNISGLVSEYTALLDILVTCGSLSDIVNQITSAYILSGSSGAEAVVQNLFSDLNNSKVYNYSIAATISDSLQSYFYTQITLLDFYDQSGCFGNDGLDVTCQQALYDDSEYRNLSQNLQYILKNIEETRGNFCDLIISKTSELAGLLEV